LSTQYQDIDRPGNFRGEIIDYGLMEFDSNSVAIAVEARIDEAWNDETKQWEDWRPYAMRATGNIFVIKKDGTINTKQVEALVQHAGWDGSLESIIDNSWHSKPCQFSVNSEVYKDQTRYRISWINDYNRAPGGLGQIAPNRVKELNAKFGGALRAVASNAKPIAKPNGKPSAPPAAKLKREPVTAENTPQDEVPF
jgi:hypothetical protein